MKLFEVIKKHKGKETILLVDSLSNVNARLKQLKKSVPKKGPYKVEYYMKESDQDVKYKAAKTNHNRNH